MKKIINGLLIGVANAVPGISGATLALILGCYDDLIELMSEPYRIKCLIKHRWMVIGMIVGIVVAVFILSFLFDYVPVLITSYFIGLIIGGIPKMVKHLPIMSVSQALLFILGMVLIILIKNLSTSQDQLTMNLGITILGSCLAGLALILPGISGTLLLMALGIYFPLLKIGKDFLVNLAFFNLNFSQPFFILCCFGLGLILSLIIFSKLIKLINSLKPGFFLYLSLGLVIGSIIVVIFDLFATYRLDNYFFSVSFGLVIGILSIFLIIKKTT